MNLVSIVIEGDQQHLHSIKNNLNITTDSSWQKGTQTPSGKLREKSGFTACISDCLTPSEMMGKLINFLHHLDNEYINFYQLEELSAHLSIGFTVGDQQQFVATIDFSKEIFDLLSKLGLNLSVSAYPSVYE